MLTMQPVDDVLILTFAPVRALNFLAINSWNAQGYPAGIFDASGSRSRQMPKILQDPVSIVAVPAPVLGNWLSSEQL